MQIHGKEYTEVKDRIRLLIEKFNYACIQTEVVWHNEDFSKLCIRAFVFPDIQTRPSDFTSGIAYEERVEKQSEVNQTSWVENCETSAIGRALANMDIGVTTSRPSAEEMKKVEKMSTVEVKENATFADEIIGFGKHKGSHWVDLPKEYLKWLIENKDTAKGVKDKAQQALNYSDLPF